MTQQSDQPAPYASLSADGAGPCAAGQGMRCVDIQFRDEPQAPHRRFALTTEGFTAEHVIMHGAREYDYDVAGTAHYLALHDLKLSDGEISLAGCAPQSRLDLRDRLTLTPATCRATGFASLVDRTNSFTAMTYDPGLLSQEIEKAGWDSPPEPMVYFRDPALATTLTKLRDVLVSGNDAFGTHAETLGLLALFEISRMHDSGRLDWIVTPGALSQRQQKQVRDYIHENLQDALPLSDLAAVTGLTRFHFARAFRRSFGTSPHQFVMRTRMERAAQLLIATNLPMTEIAARTGFKRQSHLSAAMRAHFDCTPSQYRRSNL